MLPPGGQDGCLRPGLQDTRGCRSAQVGIEEPQVAAHLLPLTMNSP